MPLHRDKEERESLQERGEIIYAARSALETGRAAAANEIRDHESRRNRLMSQGSGQKVKREVEVKKIRDWCGRTGSSYAR